MSRPIIFLCCLLFVGYAQAFPSKPHLNAIELSKLERGEIILRELPESRKGQTFEAISIIATTPEKLIAVLQDYQAYPAFMPNVSRIEVLEESSSHAIINQYLQLPMGKRKRYRLQNTIERSQQGIGLSWRMLDWPQVPSDERIGDTQGYWLLLPHNNNKTLATYHVYTDPGHVPFGLGWIVDILSSKSVPDVVKNTRDYAQRQ